MSPDDAFENRANEEGRRMLRSKRKISGGIVEGFNNRAKLTTRKAYSFRTLEAAQVALYYTLGALPELETTHRFC